MIFVNYRREDSMGMAGRLYDRLAQAFGQKNLFMDVDHIPPGVDFADHLNNQVAACDVFIAVIGANWLDVRNEQGERRLHAPDDFVAIEIAAALARDIRVIPVLIDGTRMPKAGDLPEPLRPLVRRHAINLRHDEFGRDAEALIEKIKEALGVKPAKTPQWRVAAAIAAVLLLVGSVGLVLMGTPLPLSWSVQPREQADKDDQSAAQAEQAKVVAEAESRARAEQAEKDRQAAAQLEQDRRKAAAEADARAAAAQAEKDRQAAAKSEEERKAASPSEVNHGWIGVRIQKVTADIAENMNIKPLGALVADLDDHGPAKLAGIQSGDVIVKYNDIEIQEPRDLARLVTETPAGKVALLLIIRSGKEQFKAVRVGALANQGNPPAK
jgi:hypothetical protein